MTSAKRALPSEAGAVVRLYESWRKIYPLWVSGGFQTGRRIVLGALVAVFYLAPWLRWDGHPAIRIDLPGRKLILWGSAYWPQELVLASWLAIIAALALFVVTVVAGRVWCGWACPQTVWTMVYVWIEKWVEGDRAARLRLDREPWRARWLRKKLVKFALWGALALTISATLEGLFVPIRELLPRAASFALSRAETFWLLFPASLSLLFSGVLREQVCFHMCPYARFQSVMFDRDTWVISYDAARGEPRGRRSRRSDPAAAGLGSCVDCGLCVQVCPTGIDIREGLQYECVGCAACIDVCNQMMDRMGYARNLVRYSTESRDQDKRARRLRPRLVGYASALALLLAAFVQVASHRVPLALDVSHDRNRLYRVEWDGSVENTYLLRISNREQETRHYRISVSGAGPLSLAMARGDVADVDVEAGAQRALPVRLVGRFQDFADENSAVSFTIETLDEPRYRVTTASRFVRPADLDYVRPENRR